MKNNQLRVSHQQIKSLMRSFEYNSKLENYYESIRQAELTLNVDVSTHNIVEIHQKYNTHLKFLDPKIYTDNQLYKRCVGVDTAFMVLYKFTKTYYGNTIVFIN